MGGNVSEIITWYWHGSIKLKDPIIERSFDLIEPFQHHMARLANQHSTCNPGIWITGHKKWRIELKKVRRREGGK